MANSVQHAFDIAAEDYDRTRRRLVPGFDDFYRAAIDLIRFPRESPITRQCCSCCLGPTDLGECCSA